MTSSLCCATIPKYEFLVVDLMVYIILLFWIDTLMLRCILGAR